MYKFRFILQPTRLASPCPGPISRQCPSLLSGANCNLTCASDDRECYLLDDSGYVVVSKHHEQTGRFFGDVDGTVLRAMLQHRVYKKITMFDYQAVCLDVISTGSAAWTVMTVRQAL